MRFHEENNLRLNVEGVTAITTRRSANKEDLQEICKHERSKRAGH